MGAHELMVTVDAFDTAMLHYKNDHKRVRIKGLEHCQWFYVDASRGC